MNKQFYLSVWRGHFFAGLYVIPFILMLSFTGLLMLLSPWIDDWQYTAALTQVSVVDEPLLPAQVQLERVALKYPEFVVAQYIPPRSFHRSSVFKLKHKTDRQQTLLVFVNPYSAHILGDFYNRDRWYSIADDIHGTLLLGKWGDGLIELSAGLVILLLASGLFLHWPKRKRTARRGRRANLANTGIPRSVLKNIHGTLGLYLSIFLLFFALTGMAWTGIWGQVLVQPFSSFPAEKRASAWQSNQSLVHSSLNDGQLNEIPWGLEQVPLPASTTAHNAGIYGPPLSLDTIMQRGRQLGFEQSVEQQFRIALPMSQQGVFSLMSIASNYDNGDPWLDRTVHLDQYSGEVLADVGWPDYNALAKAMALGIALHKGTLGLWNIVLAGLVCVLVIVLAVTGLSLWWKRKPKGALAAPKAMYGHVFASHSKKLKKKEKALLVITLVIAVLFPVTGLAMLMFAVFEVGLNMFATRHEK